MRSLNNSLNEEEKNENKSNVNQNDLSNNKLVKEDDSNQEKNNYKEIINNNNDNFNEIAIKFVEEFGYKRDYIIKSLTNNIINHCTATYYLKNYLLNE
jgi:hypothetical protein